MRLHFSGDDLVYTVHAASALVATVTWTGWRTAVLGSAAVLGTFVFVGALHDPAASAVTLFSRANGAGATMQTFAASSVAAFTHS
eukprot:5740874-Pleurochrysis_carterae.AAC.1